MMYTIALTALGLGVAAGWALAGQFMLRTLVGVILALVSLTLWIGFAPETLPGDGFALVVAGFLVAPPMASGMIGGAVFYGLIRRHRKPT